jgi:stress-induced morphogen
MQGVTSKETHFRYAHPSISTRNSSLTKKNNHRLVITSDAFSSKMQPARHRMVYALLRDEMAQDGGIHALQLRTLTPEEEERQRKKKEAEAENAPITE